MSPHLICCNMRIILCTGYDGLTVYLNRQKRRIKWYLLVSVIQHAIGVMLWSTKASRITPFGRDEAIAKLTGSSVLCGNMPVGLFLVWPA